MAVSLLRAVSVGTVENQVNSKKHGTLL